MYRDQYLNCSKRQKGALVRGVIQQIQAQGGRFLKLQSQHNTVTDGESDAAAPSVSLSRPLSSRSDRNFLLEVVDEDTAYKKVSHAFRCQRRRNHEPQLGTGTELPAANISQGFHQMNVPAAMPSAQPAAAMATPTGNTFPVVAASPATIAATVPLQASWQMDPNIVAALLGQGGGNAAAANVNAIMSIAALATAMTTNPGDQSPMQSTQQLIQQAWAAALGQQQLQGQTVQPSNQQPSLPLPQNAAEFLARLPTQESRGTLPATAMPIAGNQPIIPSTLSQALGPQNNQIVNQNFSQQPLAAQPMAQATGMPQVTALANSLFGTGSSQPLQQPPSGFPLANNVGPQVDMSLSANQQLAFLLEHAFGQGQQQRDGHEDSDEKQDQEE